jgi:NAD(P)H-dependent FMN reductase
MGSTTENQMIGVILCSSREPRVCPQISDFIISTIKESEIYSATSPKPTLRIIDLAKDTLPLYNEPTIPSQVKHHSGYIQPHTITWSLEIQKYSAFIFILPQYNRGYPAVAKNAIDYLFNEWTGKPALIISYGGHGGANSARQFSEVLNGVKMKVVGTMPALTFPGREVLLKALKGEDLGLDGKGAFWEEERKGILKGVGELFGLLS